MALGQLRWYLSAGATDNLSVLLHRLQRLGLRWTDSRGEQIAVLDAEGRQVSMPVAAFPDQIAARGDLNTQLWLNDDTDVLVLVSPREDGLVLEFDFDGLSLVEAHRVVAAVLWCASSYPDSRAVVGDVYLEDHAAQWDAHLLVGSGSQPTVPDLLWIRTGQELDARLSIQPGSWIGKLDW